MKREDILKLGNQFEQVVLHFDDLNEAKVDGLTVGTMARFFRDTLQHISDMMQDLFIMDDSIHVCHTYEELLQYATETLEALKVLDALEKAGVK